MQVRLIDFQIARLAPPVIDLTHFLCIGASLDVMEQLDTYLEMYYESLSDFLKELGSDPEEVYPHQVFIEQWKKFGKFGLAMLLFMLRFALSEEHEVPSLASKEEFHRTLIIDKMVNQEENDNRIVRTFKKFVASGWV